ncbi:hypothetical protein IW261DRAFT_1509224 [Armillaria novae-zelandiae]|uniref:Uncharacterized protein n=1 Tax=Armillaria novae-zelandiae TaxID=153914 RepID=A0AA39TWM8_9AGAR|nr:hypothetical protein IW261DRAFT_1509224 [Armillaria novae-zelandiae]
MSSGVRATWVIFIFRVAYSRPRRSILARGSILLKALQSFNDSSAHRWMDDSSRFRIFRTSMPQPPGSFQNHRGPPLVGPVQNLVSEPPRGSVTQKIPALHL